MSNIEPYREPARPPMLAPDSMESAWKVAAKLANTSFVPKGMRGDTGAVFATVLWASEVGVGVIQALNGVHVIEGHCAPKPEMMRALIRRHGHELSITEMSPDRCTITGTRSDTGETLTVSFTMAEARQAGLTNKPVWKSYPAEMLLARASSRIGRALFSDVIAGLSYEPDEVAHDIVRGDMDDDAIEATITHLDVPDLPDGLRQMVTDYDEGMDEAGDVSPLARGQVGDHIVDAEVVGEVPYANGETPEDRTGPFVAEPRDDVDRLSAWVAGSPKNKAQFAAWWRGAGLTGKVDPLALSEGDAANALRHMGVDDDQSF